MGDGEGDTGLEEPKDCVKWLTRPEGIKITVGNLTSVQSARQLTHYGGSF